MAHHSDVKGSDAAISAIPRLFLFPPDFSSALLLTFQCGISIGDRAIILHPNSSGHCSSQKNSLPIEHHYLFPFSNQQSK